MLRTIGFSILALVLFTLIVMAGDQLSGAIYPPPPGMDATDPSSIRSYMAGVPAAALGIMLMAHFIAALSAGFVVGRFAANRTALWTVAILMLLGGVSNLVMMPHPTWFWADALVYVPAALLGYGLGVGREGI